MRTLVLCLLTFGITASAGCYSAEIDPSLEDVFACDIDESDPEADPAAEDPGCPDGFFCNGTSCVAALPRLQLVSPEPNAIVDPDGFTISIRGTGLNLAPLGTGESGDGLVRVTLDGESIDVTSGALSGGIAIDGFAAPSEPGGHRIELQALRPDGMPYENTGATVREVFFVDDGEPHIIITAPWPNAEFDLDSPLVEFAVASLNVDLAPSDRGHVCGQGHAHVYYDREIPSCIEDAQGCDELYIAVVAPTLEEGPRAQANTAAELPASGETSATLTAVLRQNDHDPFSFERSVFDNDEPQMFDDDEVDDIEGGRCPKEPAADEPLVLRLVTDEIEINRISAE